MIRTHLALAALPLVVFACGGAPAAPVNVAEAPAAAQPSATPAAQPSAAAAAAPASMASDAAVQVVIESKSQSKLTGTATFTPVADGVKVTVHVTGAPAGKIATHVHEKGDCSSPDGKSAGGHFNPGNHSHGLPAVNERHLGDLGNIDVAADGTGNHEIVVVGANLKAGDANSFLGRAIIVHAKQDDGGQPTGNAGDRLGCGVIGKL